MSFLINKEKDQQSEVREHNTKPLKYFTKKILV